MWDVSTFDSSNANGAGGGGGGFMQGTNEFQSPSSKKGQLRRTQSVVPLAVRQILECTDEEFKLFGLPVQIANIVGILRNLEVQSTKATCTIEDHTGEIKAVLWLESDNEENTIIPPVKDGNYVQIFGSIRNQDGGKMIMILKMIPIDDLNLITSHLLQVIHARLGAEVLSKQKPLMNGPGRALATSMSAMDTSDNYQQQQQQTTSTTYGLTPMQEKVFRILQPIDTPAGLHRNAILKNFPKHQEREVNQALEFLVTEGHAYSTIDNDHFKATDSI